MLTCLGVLLCGAGTVSASTAAAGQEGSEAALMAEVAEEVRRAGVKEKVLEHVR
jgi:hypothetical protein